MFAAQMALGWCFPNAVMQYAVPDLEGLSIDQAALARRRDRLMARAARGRVRGPAAGRDVLPLGRVARGRPASGYWNALADRDVFVLPGAIMNAPGYFRISLTASDEMVERALPAFADARRALGNPDH